MIKLDKSKCILCGTCVGVCPRGAWEMEEQNLVHKRERCTLCGICVRACPTGALELKGDDVET